jgi:hypothetical protein
MTRTFDTGLAEPLRTLIRNAIVERLAVLTRAQGAFAQGIVPMPFALKSQLRGMDETELGFFLDALNGRTPAYGVALGDTKVVKRSAGSRVGELEVEIYSFCSHQRNLVLGRLEADGPAMLFDIKDPGIDVMLELMRERLDEQQLDVETIGGKAKEMRFEGEYELLTNRNQSIWGSMFSIQVELPANPNRDIVEYLTTLDTKHRIGAGSPPNPATNPLIETLTTVP